MKIRAKMRKSYSPNKNRLRRRRSAEIKEIEQSAKKRYQCDDLTINIIHFFYIIIIIGLVFQFITAKSRYLHFF